MGKRWELTMIIRQTKFAAFSTENVTRGDDETLLAAAISYLRESR